ncbi:MAG TPA: hypothetical protein VJ201_04685 [Candidatus Babeliales bacterium]|nr:hypothetical protein [Candidatus Babeliales bacterium]
MATFYWLLTRSIKMLVGGKSERDGRVIFDEPSHTYTVLMKPNRHICEIPDNDPKPDKMVMKRSVTQLVEKMFPKFDADKVARNMIQGDKFYVDKKYSDYWGIMESAKSEDVAVERILNMWEENRVNAASEGTRMHKAIESYLVKGEELPNIKECHMFMNFHKSMLEGGYLPFRSEQVVWDLDYCLAGSVDMMYILKSDYEKGIYNIYLVDWKRSKEIRKFGFGKKGLGLLKYKHDCNYEHYSLQLNIYKHLLEKNYDLNIIDMALVVLHPNQENYLKMEVKSDQSLAAKVCQSCIEN